MRKRVAILVADGFEQLHLTEPRESLYDAQAEIKIVSPQVAVVRGRRLEEWGDHFPVDFRLEACDASQFDALMLPGGAMNVEKLGNVPKAIELVRAFLKSGKPVAAVGHGVRLVMQAGAGSWSPNRTAATPNSGLKPPPKKDQ